MESRAQTSHKALEQCLPIRKFVGKIPIIQTPKVLKPYLQEFKQSEPTNLDHIA